MKITHFLVGRCNPDSANGVDKTVYYLTKYQATLGHEVAVLSLTGKNALPIPNVTIHAYHPPRNVFSLPKKLLGDLSKWKPDVVHMHSVYVPQNAALARQLRKTGVPYIVTPHGGLSPHVIRRRWYLKIPYKYLWELPMLNRAVFVHAVADKEDIQAYGVRAPVVEAPNCIELEGFPKKVNQTALWSRVPEAKGKRKFLFLGRLDPLHKGLDLLIQGFARADLHNSVLVVAGPDWQGGMRKLKELARRLNLNGRVFFTGPVYGLEKFHLIGSCDVFVHTSRWEGLPFSVLEALVMARPCLLTSPADPFGLTRKHSAAVVVEPTAEAISHGLRILAGRPRQELEKMGRRGRKLVESNFTWLRTAQILVDAYREYTKR